MRKRGRENLMLALVAFAAWQAYQARQSADAAAVLAAGADDFDPTSWGDWKSAVRNVTVTKLIERIGKTVIKVL
jgi:hypothetical protein